MTAALHNHCAYYHSMANASELEVLGRNYFVLHRALTDRSDPNNL